MKNVLLVISIVFCTVVNGQMVLDGSATGGCDCYTLTTTVNQGGSIWSPTTIDLTNSFDFTFQVNLGFADGGADGMVFVLRQAGTATGGIGSMLGYGGIGTSLGIEIDTWNSDPGEAPGDIASDHVGMHSNGLVGHDLNPAVAIPNIEDGADHDFRVIWDPATFDMEVILDGTSLFTYNGDIVTTIFGGDPNVFFGWTGATGGASNIQSVCIDLEADIVADDVAACPDQEIAFTSTSTGGLIYDGTNAVAWAWTFDGGDVSDLENPTYAYATIGSKVVSLTVTSIIGCTDIVTLPLIVDSIDVDITLEDATCFDLDNGTATAIPLTGDAPYTYLWDDPTGQITATATDLGPGLYTVLVTDDVGCEQTRSITIVEPTELLVDDISSINATCGLDDGEITFTVSGGTPPYEYSVDGGATFFPTTTFTGLADGDLNFEIKDANGCSIADVVTIVSEDLVVEMSQTNVTCFSFDNGTGTVAPEFGVGPCSYVWDDPLMQVTATANSLAPGMYSVTVVLDAIGCSGTGVITITEPVELFIDAIAEINASCGVENGEIAIEGTGGTLPYSYSIDGGVTFLPTPSFDGLAPGMYTIVLEDANGCSVTEMVELINVATVPDIIIAADFQDGCQPLEVNLENLSDPSLTASTEWTLGDGTVAAGETVNHTYINADCYDLHLTITTFDGCVTEADFEDFICAWQLPVANFDYTPEDPNVFNNEVEFENLSEYAETYEWDFADGSNSTAVNPSHVYPEVGNMNYLVELISITDKGCKDTIYKNVFIDEVIIYYIPNTVTPDSDPFNPNFKPVFSPSFSPKDYHFVIYNKWGEIVWESYDPSAAWDMSYGGQVVQDGVYIWQLTFRENSTDKKYDEYGHVTVLK